MYDNTDDSESQAVSRRSILRSGAIAGAIATIGVGAGSVSASQHACDHIVEDGDSVQAAIDEADEGDRICVSSGTYDEELVVDTPDVTIVGNDDPIVESDAGGGQPIVEVTASDVTVVGLTVQATAPGASPFEFEITGENAGIYNNAVPRRQNSDGGSSGPDDTPSNGNPAILVNAANATVGGNVLVDGPIGGGTATGAAIEENAFFGAVPDEGIWLVAEMDDELAIRRNDLSGLTTDTNDAGASDVKLTANPSRLNRYPAFDPEFTARALVCDNDVESATVAETTANSCPPVVDDVTPFPP